MSDFHAGYIGAAIRNEVNNVAIAAPSTRNYTLNRAAFNLATLGLAGSEIIHSLRPAALQSGLQNREIYSTINSGMRAGRQHPRPAPTGGCERAGSNVTPSAFEPSQAGVFERPCNASKNASSGFVPS